MGADSARRTVDLHLRLTPDEADEIDERAESFSMTRSEYMRFAAQAVLPREDRDPLSRSITYIDAETWRRILLEFRRHGVNLNQAAMACNTLARTVGPYLGSGRPDAGEMEGFTSVFSQASVSGMCTHFFRVRARNFCGFAHGPADPDSNLLERDLAAAEVQRRRGLGRP